MPGAVSSFGRRYAMPYICLGRGMRRLHSMINAGAKVLQISTCGTDHFFTPSASSRNKALLDERLSFRSAALAIVGLSLLGWAILLIVVFRLFGNP